MVQTQAQVTCGISMCGEGAPGGLQRPLPRGESVPGRRWVLPEDGTWAQAQLLDAPVRAPQDRDAAGEGVWPVVRAGSHAFTSGALPCGRHAALGRRPDFSMFSARTISLTTL